VYGHAKTEIKFEAALSESDAMFVKSVIYLPEKVIRQLPPGRVRVKGRTGGRAGAGCKHLTYPSRSLADE
jgi:hypothetical protein